MEVFFCGEKQHQVDDKNRIRIPSCFKDSLGSSYYFGKGTIPNTIEILPKSTLDKRLAFLASKLNGEFYDPKKQKLLTRFSANFTLMSEETQGRVVIPEDLKKYANISREVVTLGSIDHLVLMSAESRDQEKEEASYSDTLKEIQSIIDSNNEENV